MVAELALSLSEPYRSPAFVFAGCVRVPPAGFEPALTAPEVVAVHRFGLALCAKRGTLGRVWGAEHGLERDDPASAVRLALDPSARNRLSAKRSSSQSQQGRIVHDRRA